MDSGLIFSKITELFVQIQVTCPQLYLRDWKCSCFDRRQYWVILPAVVRVYRPVCTQAQHQNNNQNPEHFPDCCLVRLKNVEESLNRRVLRKISNHFEQFRGTRFGTHFTTFFPQFDDVIFIFPITLFYYFLDMKDTTFL